MTYNTNTQTSTTCELPGSTIQLLFFHTALTDTFVLTFLSTLTHRKVTHNSLVPAMATVAQTGPLDTPWHRETHVSRGPKLTEYQPILSSFRLDSVLLTDGSIRTSAMKYGNHFQK